MTLTRYADLEHRDGRWWYLGGEITAPFYAEDLAAIVYPPWWPNYYDRERDLTYDLSGKSMYFEAR